MPRLGSALITLPILAAVLLILAVEVQAQLPQPRLNSLSRAGMRAGETVEVTLRGTDLEGTKRLWFDHAGLTATHLKDLTFRLISAADVPLGNHDLRAVGTYGISNSRAFVIGDRPESIESEPNNTPEQGTTVRLNTVVNGELNGPTDVDCFVFEGRQGQRLLLDVQAERIDSRLDATIRLLRNDGTEFAESRDIFGADPFLDVVLPAAGRYIIKIHDAIYAGSPDHVYRLIVHDGPHVDAIIPLAAQDGVGASFAVIGRGLGNNAIADRALKADGRPLERQSQNLIAGRCGKLFPEVVHSPTMLVPSAAASSLPRFEFVHTRISPTGGIPVVSNRMLVSRATGPIIVEQEPNSDIAHAQTVAVPCDISGTFYPAGDVDLYRFQARKGEIWRIETFAERIGSTADPTILVQKLGSPGQPPQDLISADDLPDAGLGPRFNTQSVDASLRWQVPDDGLYQVLVSDLYSSQRGHPRLTYRLLIRREQPDFCLFILPNSASGPEGVTIRSGGRTSAYVGILRTDGFTGPIRVQARDLPPGVRAEPVVIGAGQAMAPIVFEAMAEAKSMIGTATLIGLSRFGDRKDSLAYTPGVSTTGPDLVHDAVAGGMTWPPNPAAATVAPARVVHGFVLSVLGEPAPLALTARPESQTVAQGHQLNLELETIQRAGFSDLVVVTATDLPPNMPAATVSIPKDASKALLPLFVPRTVPPGIYTFAIRGTGAYPFSKDPNAKPKPNVSLSEPANPITLTVRQAPLTLTIDNKGGAIKQAGLLEIVMSIARQNQYSGPVALTLISPASLKLAAGTVTLPAQQAQARLVIKAAQDSPPGPAASVFVRAAVTIGGETIDVDEPVTLSINK